jgi:uncharacterized RDD family membrane protein YckC
MSAEGLALARRETLLSLRGHTAGFASRSVAYVIDAVVVVVLWSGTAFATSAVWQVLALEPIGLEGAATLVTFGVSVVALAFAYQVLGLWLFGKTVGKLLLGLRVVRPDGRRLSLPRAMLRAAVLTFSSLVVVGCLWVLINPRRRAWHDLVAGTYVVYDWEARPRRLLPGIDDDPLVPIA